MCVSKMFDFVWEILFEQQVKVGFDFLSSTSLHPDQVKVSAFLAIQNATLKQFKAKFVVLQPLSLWIWSFIIG